jgi:hypothetical protein
MILQKKTIVKKTQMLLSELKVGQKFKILGQQCRCVYFGEYENKISITGKIYCFLRNGTPYFKQDGNVQVYLTVDSKGDKTRLRFFNKKVN